MKMLFVKIELGDSVASQYFAVEISAVSKLVNTGVSKRNAILTLIYNCFWNSSGPQKIVKDYFEDIDGYCYSLSSFEEIDESELKVLEKYVSVHTVWN